MRGLIVDLRGGVPKTCDFCHKPTLPENLHPEEAGQWVCIICLIAWEKTDASQE